MGALHRIKAAYRYLLNPGGTTRKARATRAEQMAKRRAVTASLKRAVARQREAEVMAHAAVARALGEWGEWQ